MADAVREADADTIIFVYSGAQQRLARALAARLIKAVTVRVRQPVGVVGPLLPLPEGENR